MVLVVAAVLWSGAPLAAAAPDGAAARAGDDAPTAEPGAGTPGEAADAAAAAEAARLEAAEAAARDLRDAERELARARAGLRDARARAGAMRTAGTAADGRVRAAEEALPPLVLARRTLREEIASIDAELRRLRADERRVRTELTTARDALSQQAISTFKTGRSAELLGPVAVLREARDPGQLARGLADLRAVTRDGARSVRSLEQELRELAAATRTLEARQASLAAELDEAVGAVEAGEASAAAARAAAGAAEASFVAAMEAELAARRALERAEARHAQRVAAAAEVGTEAAGPGGPDGMGEDRGAPANEEADEAPTEGGALPAQVAGRRRALERAARLTPEQRRTAEAWHCPVDEARFVNDWAFPRSGLRRHEGTDVFGDRGTPILAVTGGTVAVLDATDGRGDLGGITVTVADGEARQYYAHLQRIDPDLRLGDEVHPGDRLGWVGTSGNARGTPPHLHLGWYVDDVAVNPYASLAVACDGRARPVREDDIVPADTSDEDGVGLAGYGEEDPGSAARTLSGAATDQGWRTPSPARTARYPSR